jgi:hypothetical protein
MADPDRNGLPALYFWHRFPHYQSTKSSAKPPGSLAEHNRSPINRIVIDGGQRLIHLIETEQGGPRPNANLSSQLHKIPSILPRHIRHAA